MSLIEVNDLAIGYGNKPVAENITFTVSEGDYLCVIGENGAGKTTLMRTLLGLLEPISGTVNYSSELNRNDIGYLPQQAALQDDFPATVNEIVLSGTLSGNSSFFYSRNDRQKAQDNLRLLNIEHLAKASYRTLSGGQKQRVLLARALCASKKLLLVDEPVSGLDPAASENMYQLIRKLNEEGMTIIMISHDISTALKDCNMILHLGEDVFFGSKEEYFVKEEEIHHHREVHHD